MPRFRTLILLVCVAPVLLLAGPHAVAEDAWNVEVVQLRKTAAQLQTVLREYGNLAEIYVGQGRIDDAQFALESMRDIQERLTAILKRISEGVAKHGGAASPPAGPFDPSGQEPGQPADAGLSGRGGRRNLRAEGGSGTQGCVDLGLEWLARHQHPDGYWDCDGFGKQCKLNVCDGAGQQLYDVGVTGLALSAFLAAGETHRTGRYRKVVGNGLRYLKQVQDPEGCFGPRTSNHFTYSHAAAALAMIEAYSMTRSPVLKQSAQSAVNFILKAQNPYLAWRYGVRPQDNDTSVTGWMIMALAAARRAGGLRVPQECFDGAKTWLEKVTEPEYGKAGYTARGTGPARPQDIMDEFPADKSEALTAVAILTRILCGENPKSSEMIQKGTELCLKVPPVWDEQGGSIDMYYWYYGSLAMFQVGGGPWKFWNKAMKAAIVEHQRKVGDEKGSWDPVGPWGREGGRVYSTALMTMCLTTYYRYTRFLPPRRLSAQRNVRAGLKPASPDLEQKVTFSFSDTPMMSVLAHLWQKTGVLIQVAEDARKGLAGVTVTLSVKDLELKSILELLCAFGGKVDWTIKDGVVTIHKSK